MVERIFSLWMTSTIRVLHLNWIREDWQSSCFPKDKRWKQVWGNNVRVACLYDNESSKSKLDVTYSAVTINKANEDVWIVFPWESWWTS
jgi:hypothetical protein